MKWYSRSVYVLLGDPSVYTNEGSTAGPPPLYKNVEEGLEEAAASNEADG